MLRRGLFAIFFLVSILIGRALSPDEARTLQTDLLRRVTNTPEEKLSLNPGISGDGRVVIFESTANILSSGGAPGFRAFRADLAGEQPLFSELGITRAVAPAVSQDASVIALASKENPLGTNLDGNSEIFLYSSGQLRQVTDTLPSQPELRHVQGNFQPSISDDGRFIAFSSNRQLTGQNLDNNSEVFLYDAATTAFTQLTNTTGIVGATDAKISGDGSHVAYIFDRGITPSTHRDLVTKDFATTETRTLVSDVNELSVTYGRAISDDGLRVVYSSRTAPDTTQVFLHDGRNNAVRQITSLGPRAVDVPLNPTISGDGKRIAFATRRNVIGGNSDNSVELYIYDLPTVRLARVTTAPSNATAEVLSSLDDTGSLVAFNFPRVLSGEVSSPTFANNSEIYVATTEARPPFFTDLITQNGASHGHEPHSLKAVATDSIAVATGTVLAFSTAQAEPLPGGGFPLALNGTTVTVNDLPAQIFSVSPTRVAFHVPRSVARGFAQVVITNSEGFQTKGAVRVMTAAPGVFTTTNDGVGNAVAIDADTAQPGPFDPTDADRHAVLYATGVRQSPSQTSLTIGGRRVQIESITPSNQTPGLDEIRILLTRDFRGVGTATINLRAGHRESNPTTIGIAGDPGREVFVNEVLADPPDGPAGDANHDGVRSGSDDEFIELVNAQSDDVDISNWVVRTRAVGSTSEITRHVFAPGTIIPARDALVIFGGGTFTPSHPAFGGAAVVSTSSAGLSLTNTGMTIQVRNSSGHLITEFSYGGSTGLDGNANQSLTRSPDIIGGYALHTQSTGAQGRSFSPGTFVNGSFFLNRTPRLTRVTLSPTYRQAFTTQRVQFVAGGFDQFNRPMRFLRFEIAVANQEIASFESQRIDRVKGTATATLLCRTAGATEIRATVTDGYTSLTSSASLLDVEPSPPVVARVEITPALSTINRGTTQQLSAVAFDVNSQPINGIGFTWLSANPGVATIDSNGLAHATGLGKVEITAIAPSGIGGSMSGHATIAARIPLVINEVLADVPPDNPATPAIEGDANRDGIRDSADDEFAELFNNSTMPVDLSGVVLADTTSNRYTFPSNTTLQAGRAVVIFGGGSPPIADTAFGGAMIVTASSLGLNDAGDTLVVKLPIAGADVPIATLAFGSGGTVPAPSNQSLTRSPDAEVSQNGGDFIAHSAAVNAAGRTYSPGTRAEGTPFGSLSLTRLEIAPATATINIGEARTFAVRAFVDGGSGEIELNNVSFIWDSSDSTKATVAPATGSTTVAAGVAAGTVAIRARAGGIQASSTLIVNPPPQVLTRIDISPTNAATIVGGTRQFSAVAFDQNNAQIPGVAFSWGSDNPAVATIDQTGLATGVGVGGCQITASAGPITSSPALLNVSVPQIPTAGQVIINEALVSFTAATPTRTDFVELYNTTDQTLDLSGLRVSFRAAGNASAVSTVTLPGAVGSAATLLSPHSCYLIANGPMTFGVAADFDASSTGLEINNSSGAVMIEIGTVKLDGLRYQQNGSGVPPVTFDNFGEGTIFTFAGGTPNDLIRSPNATDTNNNLADFRRNNSHAAVSPKAANPTLP
jgi:uncharacterized protein (TIGR03437 family)